MGYARRRAICVAGVAGCAALLAACSLPDDDANALSGLLASSHVPSGSVSFSGTIPGTWHPTAELGSSVCGAGEIRIWIAGPGSQDIGALEVKSDGTIWVDIEKYGDYYAGGGIFRAGKGFSVDAEVATLRGKQAHVHGTLNC